MGMGMGTKVGIRAGLDMGMGLDMGIGSGLGNRLPVEINLGVDQDTRSGSCKESFPVYIQPRHELVLLHLIRIGSHDQGEWLVSDQGYWLRVRD